MQNGRERIKTATSIKMSSLEAELSGWRANFSWTGCLYPFFFGFLPTLWDIISDYLFANENETAQGFVYCFLCLPSTMLLLSLLGGLKLRKRDNACTSHWLSQAACSTFQLILFLAGTVGAYFTAIHCKELFLGLSLPCSALQISIKLTAIFVHGPTMKKAMTRINALESQYEANLQLLFVGITILQSKKGPTYVDFSSAASSLLIIAKAGVENLLTFGSVNKMEDQPCSAILCSFVKYVPLFFFTTVFRITGLLAPTSIDIADNRRILILLGPLLLPPVTLVLAKWFCLKNLSIIEILQGSLGELGGITVWGKLGREGSKHIQLCFHLFYISFHTPVILYALKYAREDWLFSTEFFQNLCILGLVCGWIALPLFLCQIFFMEKFKEVSRALSGSELQPRNLSLKSTESSASASHSPVAEAASEA